MDDGFNITCSLVHVHYDFLDQRPNDPLPKTYVGTGGAPHGIEVLGQLEQAGLVSDGLNGLAGTFVRYTLIEKTDLFECLVPASLKLLSDQPVLGVSTIELLCCPLLGVAGGPQVQFKRGNDGFISGIGVFGRNDRGLDSSRANYAENFARHCLIQVDSPEGDTLGVGGV